MFKSQLEDDDWVRDCTSVMDKMRLFIIRPEGFKKGFFAGAQKPFLKPSGLILGLMLVRLDRSSRLL